MAIGLEEAATALLMKKEKLVEAGLKAYFDDFTRLDYLGVLSKIREKAKGIRVEEAELETPEILNNEKAIPPLHHTPRTSPATP